MKRSFKIKEVRPRIFLFEFTDQYDMSMHFLRYQEFYESPSKKFRGKAFEILDYMEWYAKEFGKGCFSYPKDFGGYNIPNKIIPQVQTLGIADPNRYDDAMADAYLECRLMSNFTKKKSEPVSLDAPFYIIGAMKDHGALNHEISHGFFYLHPEYREEMTALVDALPAKTRKNIEKWLESKCYCPEVFVDEIVAYASTTGTAKEDKPFRKVFKRWLNG